MEPKNNKRLLDLRGSKTVLVWVYIIRFSHKGEIKEKPHNALREWCVCNLYKDFLPNVVYNRGRCVVCTLNVCIMYDIVMACTVLVLYNIRTFTFYCIQLYNTTHTCTIPYAVSTPLYTQIHITCDSSLLFYTIRCDHRNLQGVENKLVYHPLL